MRAGTIYYSLWSYRTHESGVTEGTCVPLEARVRSVSGGVETSSQEKGTQCLLAHRQLSFTVCAAPAYKSAFALYDETFPWKRLFTNKGSIFFPSLA